jgi:cytoskeletal protein CcmA (bactofilin family)
MDLSTRPDGPSRLPAGLNVTGDLTTDQDLTIDGTYDGQITLADQHLTVGSSARVKGRIVARAVTVAGHVDGNITATGSVSLLPGATVRGHLQTPSIVMLDGARFDGTVDPSRTEAAMHVAKYRQGKGEPEPTKAAEAVAR